MNASKPPIKIAKYAWTSNTWYKTVPFCAGFFFFFSSPYEEGANLVSVFPESAKRRVLVLLLRAGLLPHHPHVNGKTTPPKFPNKFAWAMVSVVQICVGEDAK